MTEKIKNFRSYNPENVFYIAVASVIIAKIASNTIIRVMVKK